MARAITFSTGTIPEAEEAQFSLLLTPEEMAIIVGILGGTPGDWENGLISSLYERLEPAFQAYCEIAPSGRLNRVDEIERVCYQTMVKSNFGKK